MNNVKHGRTCSLCSCFGRFATLPSSTPGPLDPPPAPAPPSAAPIRLPSGDDNLPETGAAAGLRVAGESVLTKADCFAKDSVAGDSVRVNMLAAEDVAAFVATGFEPEAPGFDHDAPPLAAAAVAGDAVEANTELNGFSAGFNPDVLETSPGRPLEDGDGVPRVAGDEEGVNGEDAGDFSRGFDFNESVAPRSNSVPSPRPPIVEPDVGRTPAPCGPVLPAGGSEGRGGGGRGPGGGLGFAADGGCPDRALCGACGCFGGGGLAAGGRAGGGRGCGGMDVPSLGRPGPFPLLSPGRVDDSLLDTPGMVPLSSLLFPPAPWSLEATGGSSNEPEPARIASSSTRSGLPGSSPMTPLPMPKPLSTTVLPSPAGFVTTADFIDPVFATDASPSSGDPVFRSSRDSAPPDVKLGRYPGDPGPSFGAMGEAGGKSGESGGGGWSGVCGAAIAGEFGGSNTPPDFSAAALPLELPLLTKGDVRAAPSLLSSPILLLPLLLLFDVPDGSWAELRRAPFPPPLPAAAGPVINSLRTLRLPRTATRVGSCRRSPPLPLLPPLLTLAVCSTDDVSELATEGAPCCAVSLFPRAVAILGGSEGEAVGTAAPLTELLST